MYNRCVCCGEIIPEGRQVCPNCEKGVAYKMLATAEMTMREKLIELLNDSPYRPKSFTWGLVADHLIAGGVTVADNLSPTEPLTNCQQWIPVTERLPDLILCGAGTEYSEAVNVLTSGRKVLTAIWDGTDFIADAEFWEAEGEEITHWTPVLLPPPEPPREGDNE